MTTVNETEGVCVLKISSEKRLSLDEGTIRRWKPL
jgi:hypothetical protein